MIELFTSTGKDFDSTIKFNAWTGEECSEWFGCGTEIAFDIKQVGLAPCSLFSGDQQAAVGSLLRMEAFLPKHFTAAECTEKKVISWSSTWSIGTSICESAKIAHIIEQPNI